MKTISVCTCVQLLVVLLAKADANHPIFVRSQEFHVVPIEDADDDYGLGTVHGFRDCGGSGRNLEWRVTGCTEDKICQIKHDGQITSHLDFVPSESISQLGLRFNLVKDGVAEQVFGKLLEDSAVEGGRGRAYTLHTVGGPPRELQGRTITFQIVLYSVENNVVEICSEAEFDVI